MKIHTILFAILLFYTACNCHHEGSGFVYDSETKQPLEHVRIDVYSTRPWEDTISPAIYTDATGYFEYRHDYCYDMIIASAPEYISFIFSDISKDTVYLERSKEN